ncbi:MAG: helix-turn-helix transcriptional regulator [Cyclobacteriaceae bacterium]
MTTLSRTEEILLLMVCKLGDDAYGMQIREEVRLLTGKLYSVGGIYVPLDRLVNRKLLSQLEVESGNDRLGRPRRRFEITALGLEQLKTIRKMEEKMWNLPISLLEKLKLT